MQEKATNSSESKKAIFAGEIHHGNCEPTRSLIQAPK